MGAFFGLAAMGASRLTMLALTVAIWLLSRPGGWAVLVVLALVGTRLLPAPVD